MKLKIDLKEGKMTRKYKMS